MIRLRDFRSKARGLPDLLPYAGVIAPGLIINKDDSLLCAFEVRGQDTDSSTPEELAFISSQLNMGLQLLGTGWMLHLDAIRGAERAYPADSLSHFPDRVSRMIDEERRAWFSGDKCYSTSLVLSLTYKPGYADNRMSTGFHNHKALDKTIQRFNATIAEFEDALSVALKMRRLMDYEYELRESSTNFTQSDLLSHLNQCITGELHPMRLPAVPMFLDAIIGNQDMVGGIVPKIGNKHVMVVAIDGLPQESWPAILSDLDALPVEYRFSTRFLCLDNYDAQKEVKTYCKTWRQQVYRVIDQIISNPNARMNRDAAIMAEDAEEALTAIKGGYVGAGYLTSCVVLMHEDLEFLQEKARELRRCIQTLGFGCRVETVNSVDAWLGTLPGNSFANVRRPLITTLVLADLLPVQSVWTGSPTAPCPFYPPNSPPLSVVQTDGRTPVWLNLHSGDLGHSLVFGPTGSGKSTLLGLLTAQFRRYPYATVYIMDKGRSAYALCRGMLGKHYNIGDAGGLAFAPLWRIDESEEEFAWALEWVESLLVLQNVAVTPADRNALYAAMDSLRAAPHTMRSLTDFVHRVQDLKLKEALQHYTEAGAMGRVLDARSDGLEASAFTVFEMESLMDMGTKNLVPVLLFLFHQIERSLKGQPAMIVLDEAWIMLGHPLFREKIREWLKVLRKLNCIVLLATQSLSDARNSGILDVLSESCPTKIFLANIAATSETQSGLYADLGLNSRQIQIISSMQPKREYYLVQPEGRRKIQLALGPKTLSFIGASDKESLARIDELIAVHGEDAWQETWLMERQAA